MSLHQIIYTSCMRGIDGVNDGQQVFSCDADFKDRKQDSIKSLFSYQPPELEYGVTMTEELAARMPRSFIYRKPDEGRCAVALNTYLGRDYMGSSGRFGNYLSHAVVMDDADMTVYPCELFGSTMLRDHMEFDEVNNPDPPAYLPVPVLERGPVVDPDSVTEFLGIMDRMEIFKNMLYCMLAFGRERKRIAICDEPENIVMWIAALHYALPLEMAKQVFFSTYEYDPLLSRSRICGVVKGGTKFTPDTESQLFVFDIINGKTPDFEKDAEYFDFIETALSFSFDSLADFHRFIISRTNYRLPDEDMYSAYALYSLVSDGFASADEAQLRASFDFAEKYCEEAEAEAIAAQFLTERDSLLEADRKLFLMGADLIAEAAAKAKPAMKAEAKELFVDKAVCEYLNGGEDDRDYTLFYSEVESRSAKVGFSLATELMKSGTREKLFAAMGGNPDRDKLSFMIRVVSTYVRDQRLPVEQLLPEAEVGSIYYGIVNAVYSGSAENGEFAVSRILEEFAFDSHYLVNKALNLEGMLLDQENGAAEAEKMWRKFCKLMIGAQRGRVVPVSKTLIDYGRYDRVFSLFSMTMEAAENLPAAKDTFERHMNEFVSKDKTYGAKYGGKVLELYYAKLGKSADPAARACRMELFDYITMNRIPAAFADELIDSLTKSIPLSRPSEAESRFVKNAFNYTYNFRHKPLTGRPLIIIVGMVLNGGDPTKKFAERLSQLTRLTDGEKADLTSVRGDELKDYLDWITPPICEGCEDHEELEKAYLLFKMNAESQAMFFERCTKHFMKACKGEKDNGKLCEFLWLVFKYSKAEGREAAGRALGKLSKQKLLALNIDVATVFGSEKDMIKQWYEIREIAESPNNIISGITNLFKRKKD